MHAVQAAAERAVEKLGDGAPLAEIFLEDRRIVELAVGPSGPSRAERRRRGACLRRVTGGLTLALHRDDPSADGLLAAAAALRDGKSPPPDSGPPLDPPRARITRKEEKELHAWIETLRGRLAAIDTQVRVRGVRSRQVVVIATETGSPRKDLREGVQVEAVIPTNNGPVRWSAAAARLSDLVAAHPPERIRETLLHRDELRREAAPAPFGQFPAVFLPEAAAVLVHEALGHPLEADAAGSWLDRANTIPAALTVVDDPGRESGAGSYRVDDEGERGRRLVLLEHGRPAARLRDRLSAMEAGERPTGHGRRQSYRDLPAPRLACTVLEPGDDDPLDLVANMVRGLLVERIGSGTVDPVSGALCLVADVARMVEGGRPSRPVRGLVLYGNARQWLAALEGIGNDLRFDMGLTACSKGGQTVPVILGSPSLAFSSVSVGGVDRR